MAMTYGGGKMNNPGRYLTLLPPIDGADAVSGSPYFTANPGRQGSHVGYHAHFPVDAQRVHHVVAGSWVSQLGHPVFYRPGRDYASGREQRFSPILHVHERRHIRDIDLPTAEADCGGGLGSVWFPDLRKTQGAVSAGVMVKF